MTASRRRCLFKSSFAVASRGGLAVATSVETNAEGVI